MSRGRREGGVLICTADPKTDFWLLARWQADQPGAFRLPDPAEAVEVSRMLAAPEGEGYEVRFEDYSIQPA